MVSVAILLIAVAATAATSYPAPGTTEEVQLDILLSEAQPVSIHSLEIDVTHAGHSPSSVDLMVYPADEETDVSELLISLVPDDPTETLGHGEEHWGATYQELNLRSSCLRDCARTYLLVARAGDEQSLPTETPVTVRLAVSYSTGGTDAPEGTDATLAVDDVPQLDELPTLDASQSLVLHASQEERVAEWEGEIRADIGVEGASQTERALGRLWISLTDMPLDPDLLPGELLVWLGEVHWDDEQPEPIYGEALPFRLAERSLWQLDWLGQCEPTAECRVPVRLELHFYEDESGERTELSLPLQLDARLEFLGADGLPARASLAFNGLQDR